MTSDEIFARAIENLQRGPVRPSVWYDGDWCPWCAVADAKGDLEDEQDCDGDEADEALIEARVALQPYHRDPRQIEAQEALEILEGARGRK